MSGHDFSIVTDKGFNAFLHDLAEGAWKNVSITRYDTLGRMPTTLLLEAPRPVVWKVRATWAIMSLKYALGSTSAELLEQLDAEWESAQRDLALALIGATEHKDPARQKAASRLRDALGLGSGATQAAGGYDEEIALGRQQIAITASGPLAEDVERLKLGDLRKSIHETTEALAEAIGRTSKQPRSALRSRRVREALSGCAVSFGAIHDELVWLLAHTPEGEAKRQLQALLEPFLALIERYRPHTVTPVVRSWTSARATRPYVTHAHI